MIFDGHHEVHFGNKMIVGVLHPHADGRYYSKTHYYALNFFTYWSELSAAEKEQVYRDAEISPAKAVRPIYRSYFEPLREQPAQ